MNAVRTDGSAEEGDGLVEYALLVAVLAILIVMALSGRVLPRTGLLAPLRDLSVVFDRIVSGLSGIVRQTARPFRFHFRFP
jgi:hypothetical protein